MTTQQAGLLYQSLIRYTGARKTATGQSTRTRFLMIEYRETLPSEVSKRLVRIRHAVGVFPLRVGNAFFLVRCQNFIGQLQVHRTALLVANGCKQPADGQALLAGSVDLHRHLVARTTDAFAANFDVRLDVFDGLFENLDRLGVRIAFGNLSQRIVENLLCGRLLAIKHQAIDELARQHRIMLRVWLQRSTAGSNTSHN